MKKTILLATAITFAFAVVIPVFAKADHLKDTHPYNGITYFDVGAASTQQEAAGTIKKEPVVKPFNGVTYFDLGQPRADEKKNDAAQRSAAGGTALGKKPYNGITVF